MNAEAKKSWTQYWSGGELNSCINSGSGDAKAIADFWRHFAVGLQPNTRLLDLATGNGAVPSSLLAANPALKITAVDYAGIDQALIKQRYPQLRSVTFKAGVDITNLPFEDESFQAVTSQFGFEYAPSKLACAEAARVLTNGGCLQLLIHHWESAIISSNTLKLPEIKLLLASDGLLDAVKKYLSGALEQAALELAGKHYMQSSLPKSKQITGQVFTAIEQLARLFQSSPTDALTSFHAMRGRITRELERLEQMEHAAQSKLDVETIVSCFETANLVCDQPALFYVGEGDQRALIAWRLNARKDSRQT